MAEGRLRKPVGTFVAEQLVARKQMVADRRDSGGYSANMYPETARAVVEEYPGMTPEERLSVFETLKSDAAPLGQSATRALREASQILGIPRVGKRLKRQ